MEIAVAICTVGRPSILASTLNRFDLQDDPPSEVLIVATCEVDLPSISNENRSYKINVIFSEKGLTRQRNAALKALRDMCDIVFFVDDDYWPSKSCLRNLSDVFERNENINGVTGRLLADGIGRGGLPEEDADKLLRTHEAFTQKNFHKRMRPVQSLYGCNMAFRMNAVSDLRFDEALPLYGWQEDVDFSRRMSGGIIHSNDVIGLHLGTNSGRETNGRSLGYSQVANVLYLLKKGTMPMGKGIGLMLSNVLANILKSKWPEPWVDRRERLIGNWIAIWDWVNDRIEPQKMLRLKQP